MIFSALWRLLFKSAASIFAVIEFGLSQPAASASSGFKSMTQKIIRPPFSRVNSDARQEISGGEVKATTVSCGRVSARRNAQDIEKLAKFSTLRQRLVLPKPIDGKRMISIPRQRSRGGKRSSLSS